MKVTKKAAADNAAAARASGDSSAYSMHSARRNLLAAGAAVVGAASLGSAQGLGWFFKPKAEGRSLTVAAFPAVDDIVKAILPQWHQRHPDVAVKVVSRQFADHHTAMTTALSTQFYLPDVMAVEVGYLGRFMLGSGLMDLRQAPFNIAQYQSRFVPYAYDQAISPMNGAVVGVPTDIGPGTLLYRADILAKAGLQEANLTESWDSYIKAGMQIKAKTGAYLLAHARDMKDIVIRSGIKAGDGLYFGKNSEVLVNSPRFERAFALAKQVREAGLDAVVNAWSNEWAEGFKRGTLATQMTGAWLAGHLNNWLAPDTKGLWRAAFLPDGAHAAYGGTFFAMARAAPEENRSLAWELIQLLTLERKAQLQAFKDQDAFPALVETHTDPFFEQPIDFLGGQQARLIWRETTSKISAVSVHKQDSFADEVINTELDKVLGRGKSIAAALNDAERLLKRRAFR